MANKSNIRSIRFTDEIYELIDRQAGDTFTQKLENLVTRCVWELPSKEAELKTIQERIDAERKNLSRIQSMRRRIEENAYYLDAAIRNAVTSIKRYEENLGKVEQDL